MNSNNNSMPIKSRGAMFPRRNKRSPNSPDFGGDLVLTGEVINHILSEASRNAREITIQLTGWSKPDKNRNIYISVIADIPQEREPQRDPQAGARSRPFNGGSGSNYGQGQPPQRNEYAQTTRQGYVGNGPRTGDVQDMRDFGSRQQYRSETKGNPWDD